MGKGVNGGSGENKRTVVMSGGVVRGQREKNTKLTRI